MVFCYSFKHITYKFSSSPISINSRFGGGLTTSTEGPRGSSTYAMPLDLICNLRRKKNGIKN